MPVPLVLHILKEVSKNLVKGAFPTLVTRLCRQTGRGEGAQLPSEILDYARRVVEAHLKTLGVTDPEEALQGKFVLELGPGDTLATGLLFVAYGARRYLAVDRFAFNLDSEKNAAVYRLLLDSLDGERRARAEKAVRWDCGRAVLQSDLVGVLRQSAECFETPEPVDLLVSQSALEHMRDLSRVFARMGAVCRPGAWMVHGVDLSDHHFYPDDPFKFLYFSPATWTAMHAFRGNPNRERFPLYRELLHRNGFRLINLDVLPVVTIAAVREARPRLHPVFQRLSDEDLCVLNFRFAAEKEARD